MNGKLTIGPQAQVESLSPPQSHAALGDEEKETSITFSRSCNASNTPLVIECNAIQIASLKQCQEGRSPSPSADAPRPSTFEHAKTRSYTAPQVDLSRKNLMTLIQIMLKYLDYNDRRLCIEVKKAVADCTKKNREGHPEYRSLVDSITRRLHLVVGDMHWSQLENLMDHYRKQHATSGITRSSDSVLKFVAV